MSPVLALSHNDPICAPCATALGGQPKPDIATISVGRCAHCGNERPAVAVRDYAFPAAMQRQPWQQPDDYSELESLLRSPRRPD